MRSDVFCRFAQAEHQECVPLSEPSKIMSLHSGQIFTLMIKNPFGKIDFGGEVFTNTGMIMK